MLKRGHLKLVSHTHEGEKMKKEKKGVQPRRTIVLPEEIWQRLDADAARCYRSANGHIEAILSAIYLNADTSLRGVERGIEQTAEVSKQAKAG